jgi:hypothetical protein
MLDTTTTNRRLFLTKCSTLALASGLAPTAVLASPFAMGGAVSLNSITFAQFSAQLGTPFRVRVGPRSVLGLVLVQASPRKVSHPMALAGDDAHNERFSLSFMGPAGMSLEQDTYTFEHPHLGQFAMFIVPLPSTSNEQAFYEAIFNRVPVGHAQRRPVSNSH